MTDWKALCIELADAVDLYTKRNPAAMTMSPSELTGRLMEAIARARSAQAEEAEL